MRRLFPAIMVLSMVLSIASSSSAAVSQLVMATGGTAGTYYPLGGAMAQLINDRVKDVNITVQSTGASLVNVRMLNQKEADLALIQTDIADYAWNGTESFEKDGRIRTFGAIAALYPELIQIVAGADSGINSVADLRGKRVSVGAPGSGVEANARQILDAYGLSYKDLAQVQYLSFAESAEAFKDRHIDAFFVTAGIPNSAILDVATMHRIKVLPISNEMFEKLHSKYGFFSAVTIPVGTYTGVSQPVQTVAVQAVLVARMDLDPNVVYAITRALFENLPELAKMHAKGKEMSVRTALAGVSTPLHPGAEKYFREKGVLK